jgi:hypothetical protein
MKLNLTTKLLAGALAISAAGGASAMSLSDGISGNGSIFLNVVDTTNSTSYAFDTGLHVNSFTGTSSLSFTLTSDTNYQAFITAAGSDQLQYNVIGENSNGAALPPDYKVDFTSNAALGTSVGKIGSTSNSQLQAVSALAPFINALNTANAPTATSVYVQDTGPNANDPAYFASSYSLGSGFKIIGGSSGVSNIYNVGTATNFYELTPNGDINVNTTKALVKTFAGTWDLVSGVLSFTSTSTVPLPDSLGLLLAGAALMGLIARRGKSSGTNGFNGAAA